MKSNLHCGLVIALWLGASLGWADSLELKNGSLIKGKFMGGTESEISFQVGSSLQKYNLADVVSLKFDSERAASDQPTPSATSLPSEPQPAEHSAMSTSTYATIPAGTRISVRTIDAIDSTQNQVGDRFEASRASDQCGRQRDRSREMLASMVGWRSRKSRAHSREDRSCAWN